MNFKFILTYLFNVYLFLGIFKCAKKECRQRLGVAIDYLDEENTQQVKHKGYGFKVTSFLFILPDGLATIYRRWKDVTFAIQELESQQC